MLPLQPFIVSLNELKDGKTALQWRLDGKFFGDFESTEILDADLSVGISVEKRASRIAVDGTIAGTVTVSCDRCLSDLKLPVDTCLSLSVKFSDGPAGEESGEDEDREVVVLPEAQKELDLSQIIYDYVCLDLPLRRVHPEGECDPEVVKYLGGEPAPEEQDEAPADTPFASLKTLLKEK